MACPNGIGTEVRAARRETSCMTCSSTPIHGLHTACIPRSRICLVDPQDLAARARPCRFWRLWEAFPPKGCHRKVASFLVLTWADPFARDSRVGLGLPSSLIRRSESWTRSALGVPPTPIVLEAPLTRIALGKFDLARYRQGPPSFHPMLRPDRTASSGGGVCPVGEGSFSRTCLPHCRRR